MEKIPLTEGESLASAPGEEAARSGGGQQKEPLCAPSPGKEIATLGHQSPTSWAGGKVQRGQGFSPGHTATKGVAEPQMAEVTFPRMGAHTGCGEDPGALGEGLEA